MVTVGKPRVSVVPDPDLAGGRRDGHHGRGTSGRDHVGILESENTELLHILSRNFLSQIRPLATIIGLSQKLPCKQVDMNDWPRANI